jgi:hypothetical protein
MFSTIWGICFSLKANPNRMKLTIRTQFVHSPSEMLIQIFSGPRSKRINRTDHVPLMIDGKCPSPVHLRFNGRLVAIRKPKAINLLILPDKVSSIDPEGRSLSRVACDFHNREVFGIDQSSQIKTATVAVVQ